MNNLIETKKSVDIAGQIHTITLNESEVFLKVSSSDEIIQVKLNYGFEFDHDRTTIIEIAFDSIIKEEVKKYGESFFEFLIENNK